MPNVTPVWVWLTNGEYSWLTGQAEANEKAEQAWTALQRTRHGLTEADPLPEEVRLDLLELRPSNWPRQVHLVDAALRRRMRLPDLVGPWDLWTEEERARQHLAGRRIGTPHQRFERKVSYDLDAAQVDAARLAAHRISEPHVAALKAERLVGRSARRGRAAQERREELQGQIYTIGRIIRQGIDLLRQA